MKPVTCYGLLIILGSVAACTSQPAQTFPPYPRTDTVAALKPSPLQGDSLYDRVLGMLAGAAIGDAMGAPTEMWGRDFIQAEYGHVAGLDPMVREPSPEGTWEYNLPAGSTTDDTRWKVLMLEFFAGLDGHIPPRPAQADARKLADLIISHYQQGLDEMKTMEYFEADPYEAALQKSLWLKEWALVAKPYRDLDMEAYVQAMHKFYGGEMVCGGMLFAPVVGAVYPGDPHWAYKQTYALNIYDIGYGRDIAGLVAAMTAIAMQPGVRPDTIMTVMRDVDPEGYFRSRLVGRMAYGWYRDALYIQQEADRAQAGDIKADPVVRLAIPLRTAGDSLQYARWSRAYEILDTKLERMPFHPGEIYLIAVTAMLVCDYDFAASMSFIVNFGRDNDTVGAVAGGILGAYYGASQLPPDLLQTTLAANRKMGFDLEKLARRLARSIEG